MARPPGLGASRRPLGSSERIAERLGRHQIPRRQRRRSAAPRRGWRGRQARRCRAPGAAGARRDPARGHACRRRPARRRFGRRAGDACRVAAELFGRAPQRIIAGSAIRRPVARIAPASVAPVTRITPAINKKTARMLEPSVENRCDVTHSSAWPITPPRVSNAAGCQNSCPGTGPGPIPSVPAASASVSAAIRQMIPVRIGRAGGRSSRARIRPPPATSPAGTA